MQAICNANKKIIDVFTGTPGKMHDARILQHYFIYQEGYLQKVCGSKYLILGDTAYPLEENILTPFKDYGNLTNSEKLFNKNHSKTRVVIENTFGLLKGRFRQLLKLDFSLAEIDSYFILACCVLHNLCTDDDDLVPEQPPVEKLPEDLTITIQSREKGFQKRKMLCIL